MGKSDKNSIIALLGIVAVILLPLMFIKGTENLPGLILIAAIYVLQLVYVAPMLCKKYYQLNDAECSWWAWIPVVNEIKIMHEGAARASLIALVATIIVAVLNLIPNTVVGSILGLKAGMFWKYDAAVLFIIAAVILDIVLGFGLTQVFRDVSVMNLEFFGTKLSVFEWVYYILMFIPCVNILPLFVMEINVNKLLKGGYGDESNNTEFIQRDGYNS